MASKPANWALNFVRFRWYLLALACGLTLTAGFAAKKLTFNFSPDNIYLASDPAHKFYIERFLKEFGQTANVCIIAIDGDLHKEIVQQALKDLHNEVRKISEVESVRSIVNLSVFRQKDGSLQQEPIFDSEGKTTDEILNWAAGDPAMQNLLISSNADVATVTARLPLVLADQDASDKISLKLKAAIASVATKYPDLGFYVAGTPILQLEAIGTLKKDQTRFLPLTIFLMAILLWLSFHSVRGVVLPFLATGSAAIWAMGWLVLMNHSLDIINNKLVVLLLVIGISSAVQMFARFQDELSKARNEARKTGVKVSQEYVVARSVQMMTLPCFLTTLIASLGFGSVAVSSVDIIRNFGIDAAAGIMGSFVATMLYLPAILMILPLPKEKIRVQATKGILPSVDSILSAIARFSMDNPRKIIIAALIVSAGGIYLAKDIRADQRLASELPSDAPSLIALGFIEKNLTGIMPFEIVFEGTPERLEKPDVVRAGARLEEFMSRQPMAPLTRSFADMLLSISRSLEPEKKLEPVSIWTDEKIGQLTELFDGGEAELVNEARQDFFSKGGNYYRIQGLLKDANTTTLSGFRDQVKQEIDRISLPNVKIHLTGSAMISTNALDHIIASTIASLGVAIVAIFLLVLMLLKSFRFALIALFPNLIPIIVTLASMHVFGVSLRVATVMIFSMALGIAVDSCVYLITRFREEAIGHEGEINETHKEALYLIIERTMRGSGRPVVYTTLMLLAGFSALAISKFGALRDFAILSSVTLSTALVVDLLLWPALVMLVKPKLKFVKPKT